MMSGCRSAINQRNVSVKKPDEQFLQSLILFSRQINYKINITFSYFSKDHHEAEEITEIAPEVVETSEDEETYHVFKKNELNEKNLYAPEVVKTSEDEKTYHVFKKNELNEKNLHAPDVVQTSEDEETYDVFENWAKKGDFPNQPVPHPCDRVCRKGQNMICRYTFILELHTSMGKVKFIQHFDSPFSVCSNKIMIQIFQVAMIHINQLLAML